MVLYPRKELICLHVCKPLNIFINKLVHLSCHLPYVSDVSKVKVTLQSQAQQMYYTV